MSEQAFCPVCGGKMVEKTVEKILRGGEDTAIVEIKAQVCLKCGERLYDADTVRLFEEIRSKLCARDTSEYNLVGHSYQVS